MSAGVSQPGRRLRILLVVSLGLNLLFLGAIGGAVLRHGQDTAEGRHAGGALTRALAPEDRRAIAREMRRAAGGRHQMRASWEGLLTDLRRVPFDAEAMQARLAVHRGVMQGRFDLGQSLLVERLSLMSDAERAAYADRVDQQRRMR